MIWNKQTLKPSGYVERGAGGPSSTIWSIFEYLFDPNSIVRRMRGLKCDVCETEIERPHRKRLDTLDCAASPSYPPIHPQRPITSRRCSLYLDATNCIPRRAEGFHTSWKGFTMGLKISIAHPKEDSVGATWKLSVDMLANHANMRVNYDPFRGSHACVVRAHV